ncbi:hypothetical protein RMCBS344292_16193 [Rhizopus microsporus]|nr:hypothetical protein RMCBS344292_16193 [Rhizopus microsporus]
MINKVYLLELKKYQVDPAQMVSTIGKGADRLRTAGRGASELYNEIRYIFEEGGDQQTMSTILEKAGRLAVYCLATGKELDKDAKDLSTKALRLPDSLKYLEDDDEDENKVLFFSSEVIEKIQKTRFEDSVIKISSSSSRPQGGFNGRGRFNRTRKFFWEGKRQWCPISSKDQPQFNSRTNLRHKPVS